MTSYIKIDQLTNGKIYTGLSLVILSYDVIFLVPLYSVSHKHHLYVVYKWYCQKLLINNNLMSHKSVFFSAHFTDFNGL